MNSELGKQSTYSGLGNHNYTGDGSGTANGTGRSGFVGGAYLFSVQSSCLGSGYGEANASGTEAATGYSGTGSEGTDYDGWDH